MTPKSLISLTLMVRLAGIEPTTPWFVAGSSATKKANHINHLAVAPCTIEESYRPV